MEDFQSIEGSEKEEKSITRRDFLGTIGKGALALAFMPRFDIKGEQDLIEDNPLVEVSRSYIANTNEEATKVACCLRGVSTASAENICGPLATAILLGYKLNEDGTFNQLWNSELNKVRMEGDVSPRDMWLGQFDHETRFRWAFPEETYDRYRINASVGKLDFNDIPDAKELEVGDFLYLYGGSFTHYIAISRKDPDGKIYCVSNVHGDYKEHFEIRELMLWDPKTKDGFFRQWARGAGGLKATTGTKGFYIARRKSPGEILLEDTVSEKSRDVLLNKMLEKKQGNWNILITEMGKGKLFEWRNGAPYTTDSAMKLPLSIFAMRIFEDMHKEKIEAKGLKAVLDEEIYDKKTFNELMANMLQNSDPNAIHSIIKFIKDSRNIDEITYEFGMRETSYKPSRRTSQKDMFKCWEELYSGKTLSTDSRGYILQNITIKPEDDTFLFNEIRKYIPTAKLWGFRDFIRGHAPSTQESCIIGVDSRYYHISIAGTSSEGRILTKDDAEQFTKEIISNFGPYLQQRQSGNL